MSMSRRDKRDAAAGVIGGLAGGLALTAVMLLAERATGEPSDGVAMLRRGQRRLYRQPFGLTGMRAGLVGRPRAKNDSDTSRPIGRLVSGTSSRWDTARPTLREEAAAEGGHLLLSAALGGGFGVLRRGLGLSAQPAGLVLGLGFYPLAHWLAGPLLGLMRPPWRQRPAKIAQRVALHAAFGAVTALVADRLDRRL